MIVTDSNVCPTFVLAAILGDFLQLALDVHIYDHSRHLYMSVVKSLLYFESFKTRYVLAKYKRIKQSSCL